MALDSATPPHGEAKGVKGCINIELYCLLAGQFRAPVASCQFRGLTGLSRNVLMAVAGKCLLGRDPETDTGYGINIGSGLWLITEVIINGLRSQLLAMNS